MGSFGYSLARKKKKLPLQTTTKYVTRELGKLLEELLLLLLPTAILIAASVLSSWFSL